MFGKLVPVPSGAVIPERDIGKRPILNCINLGVTFGGLKAVAVSDSLNGIIFIIGAVILIPVLAFIALGDGSIAPAGTYTWQLSATALDGSGAAVAIDGSSTATGTVTVSAALTRTQAR